ncbi:MAG: methyltransferase [Clostridia bacterium]|nr:methyltransferase [Clostridia bacterium]
MTVLEHERIDDLQIGGLRLIQNPDGFCYGTDAVLLSDFVNPATKGTVVDFCTGSGVIPILLSAKIKAQRLIGIELQPDYASMAQRSVLLNHLEQRVSILCGDIKQAHTMLDGTCEAVTCNPPYIPANSGYHGAHDGKAIARHEICCTLEDVVRSAARILKYGGSLYMVHHSERLSDIMRAMETHGIAPKVLQFVHSRRLHTCKLLLIKGVRGANSGVQILPPIFKG